MHEPPVIGSEEKLDLQTAEHSINYENQMYRVGVPWKERQPIFQTTIIWLYEDLKTLRRDLRAILCKYGASYIGTISRSDSDFDETC